MGLAEQAAFERHFLIRLAPIYLAARVRVFHGSHVRLIGHWPKPDLAFDMLGMNDYGMEMGILCRERMREICPHPARQETMFP